MRWEWDWKGGNRLLETLWKNHTKRLLEEKGNNEKGEKGNR